MGYTLVLTLTFAGEQVKNIQCCLTMTLKSREMNVVNSLKLKCV